MRGPFLPLSAGDLRRQADLYRKLAIASRDPATAGRLAALADIHAAEAERLEGGSAPQVGGGSG